MISAQLIFEQRYGIPYSTFIKREHLNVPAEILLELHPYFTIEAKTFFPLPFLPFVFNNLVIGLSLKPRATPLGPVTV